MNKTLILLLLVVVFVVALSGTALASRAPSASAVVQAAMYAHTWGLGAANDWVLPAISGEFVPPSAYPPSGVVPPSPVFQPIPGE